MRRTNRNNAICFKSLEKALAESPETYGHIDLLCAGWPCQGNSIAGKREGMQHEGSGLWAEVARCLRIFKPKWFLGENVLGLLSVNEGRDFYKVISELQEIGYGVSWRILDSQYFGVAQRRKRVFIVGYFGDLCPPEILFEQKGGFRNDKKKQKAGQKGLCISTRDGQKQNPTAETLIAQQISPTIIAQDDHETPQRNIVAQTLRATKRGNASFVWQDTHIAETNPKRKGKTTRTSKGLDSRRGILIGNAVTVNVAEWIGKRIVEWERKQEKKRLNLMR